MTITFEELKDRLKSTDEVTVLELLEIYSDELVERFSDKLEERYEEIAEEFEEAEPDSEGFEE